MGDGLQEVEVLAREVPRRAAVRSEETEGKAALADQDVRAGHDAGVAQRRAAHRMRWEVVDDDGFGVVLARVVGPEARDLELRADEALGEPDRRTGAHLPVAEVLERVGEVDAEGLPHEPAGGVEQRVELAVLQREVAEPGDRGLLGEALRELGLSEAPRGDVARRALDLRHAPGAVAHPAAGALDPHVGAVAAPDPVVDRDHAPGGRGAAELGDQERGVVGMDEVEGGAPDQLLRRPGADRGHRGRDVQVAALEVVARDDVGGVLGQQPVVVLRPAGERLVPGHGEDALHRRVSPRADRPRGQPVRAAARHRRRERPLLAREHGLVVGEHRGERLGWSGVDQRAPDRAARSTPSSIQAGPAMSRTRRSRSRTIAAVPGRPPIADSSRPDTWAITSSSAHEGAGDEEDGWGRMPQSSAGGRPSWRVGGYHRVR